MSAINSSDLLLKPKERERLARVREMLAKGMNPYAKENNESRIDLGKSSYVPVVHDDTERIAALEAKWARLPLGPEIDLEIPSLYTKEDLAKIEARAKHPNILLCSYCKVEVGNAVATRGKTTKIKRVEDIVGEGADRHVEVKYVFRAVKVVACPKCALKIKPTEHRNKRGQVTGLTNNIEWPQSEG